MKKIIFILLIIGLVGIPFLIGCAPPQPTQKEYVCSNKIVVSDPSDCPTLTVKLGSTDNTNCFSDTQCLGSGNWITQEDGYTQVRWGCDLQIKRCVVKDALLIECSEVKPCKYGQCFYGVCR